MPIVTHGCLFYTLGYNPIQLYFVVQILPVLNIISALLEKAMETHPNTLPWKISWMEEPGRPRSMGSLRVGHDWATSLSRIGAGNGNPLQCSCLENPRDGGACGPHGVRHNWSDLAAATAVLYYLLSVFLWYTPVVLHCFLTLSCYRILLAHLVCFLSQS